MGLHERRQHRRPGGVVLRDERVAQVARPQAGHRIGERRRLAFGLEHRLLPELRRGGLPGGDEPRAQHHALGAQRESGDQASPVGDAAGGDHRRPDRVDDLRNERDGRHALGAGRLDPRGPMAARLAALGHDGVDAGADDGARVLDAADHRDDLDVALVAAADHVGARIAERDGEHGDALLQDDLERGVDDVGQAGRPRLGGRQAEPLTEAIERVLNRAHARLRDRAHVDRRSHLAVQPQVHAERSVGEPPHGADRPSHSVGWQLEPGDDPEAAGFRHLGHQLGTGHAAHPRLHDRIVDTQQVAQRRAQAHPPISFSACSRSFTRWTLSPCGLGVRGTSLTKRTILGILNEAILPRQNARSSSSVSRAWGFKIT